MSKNHTALPLFNTPSKSEVFPPSSCLFIKVMVAHPQISCFSVRSLDPASYIVSRVWWLILDTVGGKLASYVLNKAWTFSVRTISYMYRPEKINVIHAMRTSKPLHQKTDSCSQSQLIFDGGNEDLKRVMLLTSTFIFKDWEDEGDQKMFRYTYSGFSSFAWRIFDVKVP